MAGRSSKQMETKIDWKKELDKYKEYLSSCLKTPELSEEQNKELKKIIQNCRIVADLSVKNDSTE